MDVSSTGRPTFGGLASGLDTNALLAGLLEIERIPLNRIQARRAEIDQQRGLMRDLNTKLLALRDAAKELDNRTSTGTGVASTEEFLKYEGSSSDDEVVTVEAGSGASPGDIDVLVTSLATGSRRFSESYSSSSDAALTSGQSITIDLPNGDTSVFPNVDPTSLTITAGADGVSLQELRDQINTSADNGGTVRADVLQISDDEFRLVLTSTGTGTSNNLAVSGDVVIDTDPDLNQDSTNAVIEVFGQSVERESNFIDDLLTGVTLRLVGEAKLDDSDNPITETVTVGVDVDEVVKGIKKFTNAYNDIVSFIDRQFSFDEGSNTSGPLSGDSTLRSVQAQLRGIVSNGYKFSRNPNNPFAPTSDNALGGAISNIGIELGGDGTLSINKETLEEALALDPLSVSQFLSGTDRDTPANQAEIDANTNPNVTIVPDLYDEGFAQLIASQIEQLVRSGDGAFAERDASFARVLSRFDDDIANVERRIGQREETLIQRFASLEQIVSGLQSQQGFLGGL